MQLITIFMLSVGLAMDAFAVSLGIGTASEIHTFDEKFDTIGYTMYNHFTPNGE